MKKGFTLIELMIVVVIIGILAAIAIPKFSNVKDQAEESACRSQMGSLATAEEMYYADFNTYGDAAELAGSNMLENATGMQCPTANAGYVIANSDDGYTIPCPNGDSHGTIVAGIKSWQ